MEPDHRHPRTQVPSRPIEWLTRMAMFPAIDYFCNVFTPEGLKKIFHDNPEVRDVMQWWNMEERLKGHSPDDFLRVLDEAGVEKVMIPISALGSYDYRGKVHAVDPEDLIPILERHPDRYHGVARINPFERMRGVREVETLVRKHNFKGAFLHTYGFGIPLNHRDYWPFYAKCEELGVPVVMQVGHSAERMPSELGRPIHLDDIALYFPELKLVGSHTGWPWVDEMIALAWKHKNVFIGCGAHAPKFWDPKLVQFMNSRGKGKVMWGTDYPIVLHRPSMDQVRALGLRADAEAALLRETAVTVFGL